MVRKIIAKLGVLLMATFVMTSCDPDLGVANTWDLYNNTDQVLIYRFNDLKLRYIYPGERMNLYTTNIYPIRKQEKRDVNIFFEDNSHYTKFSIYKRGQTDTPVVVWQKEDKNAGGKQFFNGNSWYLLDDIPSKTSEAGTWVFEITSEDLK